MPLFFFPYKRDPVTGETVRVMDGGTPTTPVSRQHLCRWSCFSSLYQLPRIDPLIEAQEAHRNTTSIRHPHRRMALCLDALPPRLQVGLGTVEAVRVDEGDAGGQPTCVQVRRDTTSAEPRRSEEVSELKKSFCEFLSPLLLEVSIMDVLKREEVHLSETRNEYIHQHIPSLDLALCAVEDADSKGKHDTHHYRPTRRQTDADSWRLSHLRHHYRAELDAELLFTCVMKPTRTTRSLWAGGEHQEVEETMDIVCSCKVHGMHFLREVDSDWRRLLSLQRDAQAAFMTRLHADLLLDCIVEKDAKEGLREGERGGAGGGDDQEMKSYMTKLRSLWSTCRMPHGMPHIKEEITAESQQTSVQQGMPCLRDHARAAWSSAYTNDIAISIASSVSLLFYRCSPPRLLSSSERRRTLSVIEDERAVALRSSDVHCLVALLPTLTRSMGDGDPYQERTVERKKMKLTFAKEELHCESVLGAAFPPQSLMNMNQIKWADDEEEEEVERALHAVDTHSAIVSPSTYESNKSQCCINSEFSVAKEISDGGLTVLGEACSTCPLTQHSSHDKHSDRKREEENVEDSNGGNAETATAASMLSLHPLPLRRWCAEQRSGSSVTNVLTSEVDECYTRLVHTALWRVATTAAATQEVRRPTDSCRTFSSSSSSSCTTAITFSYTSEELKGERVRDEARAQALARFTIQMPLFFPLFPTQFGGDGANTVTHQRIFSAALGEREHRAFVAEMQSYDNPRLPSCLPISHPRSKAQKAKTNDFSGTDGTLKEAPLIPLRPAATPRACLLAAMMTQLSTTGMITGQYTTLRNFAGHKLRRLLPPRVQEWQNPTHQPRDLLWGGKSRPACNMSKDSGSAVVSKVNDRKEKSWTSRDAIEMTATPPPSASSVVSRYRVSLASGFHKMLLLLPDSSHNPSAGATLYEAELRLNRVSVLRQVSAQVLLEQGYHQNMEEKGNEEKWWRPRRKRRLGSREEYEAYGSDMGKCLHGGVLPTLLLHKAFCNVSTLLQCMLTTMTMTTRRRECEEEETFQSLECVLCPLRVLSRAITACLRVERRLLFDSYFYDAVDLALPEMNTTTITRSPTMSTMTFLPQDGETMPTYAKPRDEHPWCFDSDNERENCLACEGGIRWRIKKMEKEDDEFLIAFMQTRKDVLASAQHPLRRIRYARRVFTFQEEISDKVKLLRYHRERRLAETAFIEKAVSTEASTRNIEVEDGAQSFCPLGNASMLGAVVHHTVDEWVAAVHKTFLLSLPPSITDSGGGSSSNTLLASITSDADIHYACMAAMLRHRQTLLGLHS